MPGTTATQGLIYPVQTDRACDGALQIEVLAKGIQARYTVLDTLVDTGEMPEAVMVEWNAENPSRDPLTLFGVTWNTVQLDTAEAFDTGISQVTLELPYDAPGQLWELGMYADGIWPNGQYGAEDAWNIDLRVSNASGTMLTKLFDVGVPVRAAWGYPGGGSLSFFHKTAGAGERVSAAWSGPGPGSQLRYAQMWAIRVAEA